MRYNQQKINWLYLNKKILRVFLYFIIILFDCSWLVHCWEDLMYQYHMLSMSQLYYSFSVHHVRYLFDVPFCDEKKFNIKIIYNVILSESDEWGLMVKISSRNSMKTTLMNLLCGMTETHVCEIETVMLYWWNYEFLIKV